MIFAQIKDTAVENMVVLQSTSVPEDFNRNPLTGEEYDFIITVDDIVPMPQIGWTYINGEFFPPQEPIEGE